MTVGKGTVIEVADKAVYCECGSRVEEGNDTLIENAIELKAMDD